MSKPTTETERLLCQLAVAVYRDRQMSEGKVVAFGYREGDTAYDIVIAPGGSGATLTEQLLAAQAQIAELERQLLFSGDYPAI